MGPSPRWIFLLLSFIGSNFQISANAEPVLVYAAVSLTNVLQEVGKRYSEDLKEEVRFSFSGSSTLARQIKQGALAEIYISANSGWMDYLDNRRFLEEGTRRKLLGNSLVLIVPKGEEFNMEQGAKLSEYFEGRLALADPSHVPAGIYGMQALFRMGWWEGVKDRLALGQDARMALVYVERGACSTGIVYSTDAAISSKVVVVFRFPDSSSDPIVYEVAILRGKDRILVRQLVQYLWSDVSEKIFKKFGFQVLR